MIQKGMSLREALQQADKLGCTVTEVHRTGEISVSHPNYKRRERLNSRRLDAPAKLVTMLRKLSRQGTTDMAEQILTLYQVEAELGVNRQTLRAAAERKEIPAEKHPDPRTGFRWIVKRADLETVKQKLRFGEDQGLMEIQKISKEYDFSYARLVRWCQKKLVHAVKHHNKWYANLDSVRSYSKTCGIVFDRNGHEPLPEQPQQSQPEQPKEQQSVQPNHLEMARTAISTLLSIRKEYQEKINEIDKVLSEALDQVTQAPKVINQ